MSNVDRFLDQIGEIDPVYLEEFYHRKEKEKKNTRKVLQFGMFAASFVLVLTLSLLLLFSNLPSDVPYDTDGTKGTTDMEANPTLPINSIIFAGNSSKAASEAILIDSVTGKSLPMDYFLYSALQNAEEDTLFAFTVYEVNSIDVDAYEQFREKCSEAEEILKSVAEKCITAIMTEKGISREEASARKFSHPDFIAAREKLRVTIAEYQSVWIASLYEKNKETLEVLKDLGFVLVYDATDPLYHAYFCEMQSIAVMAGTKEQIMKLARNCSGMFYLYAGMEMESAKLYGQTDFYTPMEVFLPENIALTEELLEKYALVDGGSIDVMINIAYFGQEGKYYETREEIHSATLAILGMTAEEFDRCNDMDIIQRYLTEKRRLLQHSDYHEDLAERLMLPGELIEIREWAGGFIASLTYERALALSLEHEVAYIQSRASYENHSTLDLPVFKGE